MQSIHESEKGISIGLQEIYTLSQAIDERGRHTPSL